MRCPKPSKARLESQPPACVLVANLLETRDNILRSDFEDSLEGYENKKIVLVD